MRDRLNPEEGYGDDQPFPGELMEEGLRERIPLRWALPVRSDRSAAGRGDVGVRVNLLPRPSWGRRHFFLGLLLVILWLRGLFRRFFGSFLSRKSGFQRRGPRLAQLEPCGKRGAQAGAGTGGVHEEHGPALAYVEAVDRLDRERLKWDEAISALEASLPPSATVFDLQVKGTGWKGRGRSTRWMMWPFLRSMMEKSESITSFSVDSIGKSETDPSLEVKPKKAWIVRFHLTWTSRPKGDLP